MKAVALTGLRQLELMDVPPPRLEQPTDVLLRIEKVGICGSDLHYFEAGRIASRVARFPFIIGHECSATVLETGARVTRVQVGDPVAVDPAMSCYACDQCRSGRPHTCRHLKFLGCPGEAEGCLQELLVLPETCLYPTLGRITLEQAALCEPLSIGLYALRSSGLGPGAEAAILGAGPIGLSVLLSARQAGTGRVWVTDLIPERLAAAQQMGATWSGNPKTEAVVARILEEQPLGLDAVFECAGKPETLEQALELLKPGGHLVIVGIPHETRVSFPIDALRRKEITINNVRRQNHCVQLALDLVSAGAIRVDPLLTHRFQPEQAQEAFETVAAYRDGVIKAVIEF